MQSHAFPRQYLCSELVTITRLSKRRTVEELAGNLEEIGEGSALILTQAAVPLGVRLGVKGESEVLKGTVMSCSHDLMLGFFIEVHLDTESRWSEKWFVPKHLLALSTIMTDLACPVARVPKRSLSARSARV
jgi:hypothetical protein